MKPYRVCLAAAGLAVGLFTLAVAGGDFVEKTYVFDLVNWDDQTTRLLEPDGKIPVKLRSAGAEDERELDRLYQREVLPTLMKERDKLREKLAGIDARLGGGDLDDDAVKAMANEAQDAYHAAVGAILEFVAGWNRLAESENPYHQSKALAVAGFFARQAAVDRTYSKDWSSSSTRSKTTTVETPQGTLTRSTTRTSGSSVSVGVNPAGAIMGLTGLFAKKRKTPPEPPYLAAVRDVIDAANALGDLDESDGKTWSRMTREAEKAEDSGDREKARDRMLPLLDDAADLNRQFRLEAQALRTLVQKALDGGAADLPDVAEGLRALDALSEQADAAARDVESGIGSLRRALGTSDPFRPSLDALLKATVNRETVAGRLHDQGYRVSRKIDY
ncbi:MAG: hypothetical protein KA419_19845 [Acidobacteria bacterium]|nr:hypothetical protein [Acidobacteriota bacterium]